MTAGALPSTSTCVPMYVLIIGSYVRIDSLSIKQARENKAARKEVRNEGNKQARSIEARGGDQVNIKKVI